MIYYISTIAAEINPAGQNIRPNSPARSHDYFHVYSRDAEKAEMFLRGLTPEEKRTYKESDVNGQFLWDNLRRRGGNSRPEDRPKQWFPLYASLNPKKVSVKPFEGSKEIYPIDPKGINRIWRNNLAGAERDIKSGDISVIEKAERIEIVKKSRMPEGRKPKTMWYDSKYSATTHGTKLLLNIIGKQIFSYPKSIYLVKDSIENWIADDSLTLDYFAGSGTTGHAVINLNREDQGKRKYILVEMGTYFNSVTKPRVQKVAYSNKWKDGSPEAENRSLNGVSHLMKYMSLEQYEDTLDNLVVDKTQEQASLLAQNPQLKEDYLLSYMMEFESKESLLSTDIFANPFDYTLRITRDDETQLVKVDLVETFNYLIGLEVETIDYSEKTGILALTGKNSHGEKCLILWRDTHKIDAEALDKWFSDRYSSKDLEFDAIYVNGDNHIENLKTADDRWKVRLTEVEFQRLMFAETV